MKVRRHFYFSGRVQGVGFRYRATYAARSAKLTGWVKNLWDGRVEMEIQGDDAQITHLLYQLRKDRFIRITDIESEELPLAEGETDFSPRGY